MSEKYVPFKVITRSLLMPVTYFLTWVEVLIILYSCLRQDLDRFETTNYWP